MILLRETRIFGRSDVLTAVLLASQIFWCATPCWLGETTKEPSIWTTCCLQMTEYS